MGRDQELMRLAFCLYPLPFSLYCPFNSVYGIMSYDRTYRENRRLVTTKSLHDRLGDYLEEIEPIFAKVNGMENEEQESGINIETFWLRFSVVSTQGHWQCVLPPTRV